MTSTKKPLLGLCPIGKFVFSNEDAIRQKAAVRAKLLAWDVPFVDLEGVLEDGLVKDQKHVGPVVEHLEKAGIDALFVPHCNFGTEGAVGMIGHKLGVPTLLWGPRDEAPLEDGSRLRDSLCGMFASSKVLHKLGVPFTYIENCRVDDAAFEKGVDMFLRAVAAASVLRKGIRIGHIGQRIDFFWTTIVNESELLERFNVEILPIDLVVFLTGVRKRLAADAAAYAKEGAQLRKDWVVEDLDEATLSNILAVRDELRGLREEHGLDALAVEDFDALVDEMGAYCFMADGWLAEECGVGIESDIHGAISTTMLRRALFEESATFLCDITVRHPENDNGVLLWHAGGPPSMCHPDDKVRLGHHWILPSPVSGMPHFRLKDGAITVARFDGDGGEYCLAAGQGKSIDGPWNQNNYVWMEVSDWPRWERTLMEGPFIHHAAMGYGHVADAMLEACKYVPGLDATPLDGAA